LIYLLYLILLANSTFDLELSAFQQKSSDSGSLTSAPQGGGLAVGGNAPKSKSSTSPAAVKKKKEG
jgi:hypothetical protein